MIVGKILVIEIGSYSLKGIVVRRSGRRLVVVSTAAVPFSGDVAPDVTKIGRALTNLLSDLGAYPKKVIVVTNQVRFFVGSLEIPNNVKIPEDRITGAVTWEVEPYLDFPVIDGMFGHRLCRTKSGGGKTPAVISAIEKNAFADIVSVFKDFDLTVCRVYSPEGAVAFASENNFQSRSAITFYNDGQSLISAFIRPGSQKPVLRTDRLKPGFTVDAVESIPLEPGIPLKRQVMDIIQAYQTNDDIPGAVILGGESVSEDLVDDIQGDMPGDADIDIRLWDMAMDLGSMKIRSDAGPVAPVYAAALGAAIQEFGKTGQPLGLTDRVSMTEKVRHRIHLAPVLALVFVILCFGGHYIFLQKQMAGFAKQLEALNKDKQVYTGLKNERTSLLKHQKDIKSKEKYLTNILPERQKHLMGFLTGLPGVVPDNIVVTEISQAGTNVFILTGRGLRTASVGVFAMQLAGLDGIRQAEINGIERIAQKGDTTCMPYEFSIQITLKG